MHKQQENLKFMSHFNNGLLIKQVKLAAGFFLTNIIVVCFWPVIEKICAGSVNNV